MNTPREPAPQMRLVVQAERLTPVEASAYLMEKHRIKVAPATLSWWRSTGGGPAFRKAGRQVLYEITSLDRWANERLGDERSSTSDMGAH